MLFFFVFLFLFHYLKPIYLPLAFVVIAPVLTFIAPFFVVIACLLVVVTAPRVVTAAFVVTTRGAVVGFVCVVVCCMLPVKQHTLCNKVKILRSHKPFS